MFNRQTCIVRPFWMSCNDCKSRHGLCSLLQSSYCKLQGRQACSSVQLYSSDAACSSNADGQESHQLLGSGCIRLLPRQSLIPVFSSAPTQLSRSCLKEGPTVAVVVVIVFLAYCDSILFKVRAPSERLRMSITRLSPPLQWASWWRRKGSLMGSFAFETPNFSFPPPAVPTPRYDSWSVIVT